MFQFAGFEAFRLDLDLNVHLKICAELRDACDAYCCAKVATSYT